jgi:hypothetical protein
VRPQFGIRNLSGKFKQYDFRADRKAQQMLNNLKIQQVNMKSHLRRDVPAE